MRNFLREAGLFAGVSALAFVCGVGVSSLCRMSTGRWRPAVGATRTVVVNDEGCDQLLDVYWDELTVCYGDLEVANLYLAACRVPL